MRKLKIIVTRIFLFCTTISIVAIGILAIFVHFKRDMLIGLAIEELNKIIKTPVQVQSTSINLFSHFPQVTLEFKHIVIKESTNNHKDNLAELGKLGLTFNALNFFQRNYTIDGIYLQDGEVSLKRTEHDINYDFIEIGGDGEGSSIDMDNIVMDNIHFSYSDATIYTLVEAQIDHNESTLKLDGPLYYLTINGGFLVERIKYKNDEYFKQKKLHITSQLDINDKDKKIFFKPSPIQIGEGKFDVKGDIDYMHKTILNLQVSGVNTNIKTLFSLLPSQYEEPFKKYNSTGHIYFNASVIGEASAQRWPHVEINFGAQDATIHIQDYNLKLTNLNATGNFSSGYRNVPETYHLALNDLSFITEGKLLKGEIDVQNFSTYQTHLLLRGELPARTIEMLFLDGNFSNSTGGLIFDIDIHSKGTSNDFHLVSGKGAVDLTDVSTIYLPRKLHIDKISGNVIVVNNDLAINNIKGFIGNSDIQFNGFLKDFNQLMHPNPNVKIEADLIATRFFMKEMLNYFQSGTSSGPEGNNSTPDLIPQLSLDLNCKIDHLFFDLFKGRNASGQLKLKNKIFTFNDIRVSSMGGKAIFNGSFSGNQYRGYDLHTDAELDNVFLDSLFYVFKNFNQSFLVKEHLKGRFSATVNTYFKLDKNLELQKNTLWSDINIAIKDGELINFEPLLGLSKYVEEKSLNHLRFSEVKNNILIQNQTIYLPKMDVYSNISAISIEGTHTFDQKIDYKVAIPLKKILKLKKIEAGDIEQSMKGSRLYLKIVGTTDDYQVKLDKATIKEKLKSSFKNEGTELKNAFKKDSIKVPELEEDEYFDFDDK